MRIRQMVAVSSLTLMSAAGLAAVAAPAFADCTSGTVYTTSSTTAPTAVGTCLDTETGIFQGGSVEAGTGGGDVYVFVDGDNDNDTPVPTTGYVGVSNYESAGESDCDGVDDGSGTNSGGCLYVKQAGGTVPPLPVPLVACGNTSGEWYASDRDGCSLV